MLNFCATEYLAFANFTVQTPPGLAVCPFGAAFALYDHVGVASEVVAVTVASPLTGSMQALPAASLGQGAAWLPPRQDPARGFPRAGLKSGNRL